MTRRRRTIIILCIITFVLVSGIILTGIWLETRDFRDNFSAMRGELGEIEELGKVRKNGYTSKSVGALSSTGIPFSARIKVPERRNNPLAALIILGGLRTGKDIVDYMQGTPGMIIMAIDYPYEGKKEDLSAIEFMLALSDIRKAVLETPPAVMLGVDYLLSRDDVDPEMITLIGGSLGAFFVPAVMASDPRIDAAAILFGAGDLKELIKNEIDLPFPLPCLGSSIASVLVSPVEPLKYVAGISPRPLLILNGKADPRIPAELAMKLHDAAGEPKTVAWIDCGHMDVKSEEFNEKVVREVLGWLQK
ncbi:MAG: prolyl oligopeptidase family serine peptidase [Candidatus Krumholzibacteriota bacterium]|nr:prolyl oligopeptidase family serine peptidase [Candidatus Krumholzibacteriota bacterium]